MKKTPIVVVAGLVVVGAGYFGGMHYASNKTMDFLHAQVDKINANAGSHAEIQDEKRGMFTSTAKVVLSDSEVTINMPLTIQHGLFNTDVSSDEVRVQEHGENALKELGPNIESVKLAAHLHNSGLKENDYRGSDITLMVPGQIVANDKFSGSRVNVLNPSVKLQRDSDGKLVASLLGDKLESSEEDHSSSNTGAFAFSFTYDIEWSDRLVQAANAYIHDDSEQNLKAFQNLVETRLPDIHADMKNLNGKVSLSESESTADHVILDINRDSAAEVTRLVSKIEGIGNDFTKGNFTMKMALDQRVVDTFMKVASNDGANMDQDFVAVAQTSPRLVIEELRMFDDHSISVSAKGEVSIDGSAIKSTRDFNPTALIAKLTVEGLPANVADMAKMYGLDSIKANQPVVITANKGSVAVNGQTLF